MKTYACSIFGNSNNFKKEDEEKVKTILKELVEKEKVTEFVFTTKEPFSNFCFIQITLLKLEHPFIQRIYHCEESKLKLTDSENFDNVIPYKANGKEEKFLHFKEILLKTNIALFYIKKTDCEVNKAYHFADMTTQPVLNLLKK